MSKKIIKQNEKYLKKAGITEYQRIMLVEAWNYADDEDKSMEWMFAYMSDMADLEYDKVVDFVMNYERTKEDFE